MIPIIASIGDPNELYKQFDNNRFPSCPNLIKNRNEIIIVALNFYLVLSYIKIYNNVKCMALEDS